MKTEAADESLWTQIKLEKFSLSIQLLHWMLDNKNFQYKQKCSSSVKRKQKFKYKQKIHILFYLKRNILVGFHGDMSVTHYLT